MSYQLMDKLVCVRCKKVDFVAASGKSSRTYMVECRPSCGPEALSGVPKADESARKPK